MHGYLNLKKILLKIQPNNNKLKLSNTNTKNIFSSYASKQNYIYIDKKSHVLIFQRLKKIKAQLHKKLTVSSDYSFVTMKKKNSL